MAEADRFGLFVSCVDGQPVTRYGTRTLIGAQRNAREPTRIDYRPDQVVALTHAECAKYRHEYDRALSNGSLVRRTAADWLAYCAAPAAAPVKPEPEPTTAGTPSPQPSPSPARPRRSASRSEE